MVVGCGEDADLVVESLGSVEDVLFPGEVMVMLFEGVDDGAGDGDEGGLVVVGEGLADGRYLSALGTDARDE